MRILVTGAEGFVGTHAVRRLVAAGHDVRCMTIDGRPVLGLESLRADVRDHHVVLRHVEAVGPDAVLHLAGIAFVPAARKDPRLAFDVNAGGTLNVLAACRDAAPGARVVCISTAEVYGRVDDPAAMPLTEDRPIAPVTMYGASKASAEHVARAFAGEGVDALVLRPFNHVGPGQDEAFVISSFAHQIARIERDPSAEPVLRHGNLDAVRDFLDVRDIVAAYERALTAPRGTLAPGAAYNLASGEGVPISRLVDLLVGLARREITHEIDPDRLRKVDVPVFVGDATRFREATGWRPEMALERTLADALEEARGSNESRGEQREQGRGR